MRIRTALAALGLAAAVVTGTAGSAAAYGSEDHGTSSYDGNGSTQAYGNTVTGGSQSPQIGLVQGTLDKPCVALPVNADLGSLVGVIPITAQDVNVLTSPQDQQCAENSSQFQGDGPLSHVLSGIPVLSGNGVRNR
jgi:hypothetical protein